MEISHLRCWISNGEDKYVGFILNFCKVAVQKDYARTQFNLISFFFFYDFSCLEAKSWMLWLHYNTSSLSLSLVMELYCCIDLFQTKP